LTIEIAFSMLPPKFVVVTKVEGILRHDLGFEWNSLIWISGIHVASTDLIEIGDV
jgi:hypothetical protein